MQVKKRVDPPLSLYGQLFWREFFYTAATNNPKFDRMAGNQICVQIPWDKNPEALAKWAEVCWFDFLNPESASPKRSGQHSKILVSEK